MLLEEYSILIEKMDVTITVKKIDDDNFPYFASCHYKGIEGRGESIEQAKEKCEAAVRMDIMTN